MEIILLKVPSDPDCKALSFVVEECIYNHFNYHNYKTYSASLNEPEYDAAVLAGVDSYNPEQLVLTLHNNRGIEELPVDYQSKVVQVINIEKPEK